MSLTTGLDRLLDRSVVLGYSRTGPALRRHWWPADPPPGALDRRVVAVTGANSGVGRATATGAARLGAEVHLLCRDVDKGAAARREILAEVPGAALVVRECDVSDLAALPGVARELAADVPRLHGLVHNAGVMPPRRTENRAGHELALATHVLGPHLLTDALRGALAADGDARVVFVSSGGMYTQPLVLDDLDYTRSAYKAATAYARTKRMQVHLAEAWSRELAGEGVAVHGMHPGWAGTPGLRASLPGFSRITRRLLRTAAGGADTVVWLLAAAEASAASGLFWHDRRPRPTAYLARTAPTDEQVHRLWEAVVGVTGRPVGA